MDFRHCDAMPGWAWGRREQASRAERGSASWEQIAWLYIRGTEREQSTSREFCIDWFVEHDLARGKHGPGRAFGECSYGQDRVRGDELGIRHFSTEPGGTWSYGEPRSIGFECSAGGERECKLFSGWRYDERRKSGQPSCNGLGKCYVARVKRGACSDLRVAARWADRKRRDGLDIREQCAVQAQSCVCTVAASSVDQWNAEGQLVTWGIRRPGSCEPCVKGQRRCNWVDECDCVRLERGHGRILWICAAWGDSMRGDSVAIRHKSGMPN